MISDLNTSVTTISSEALDKLFEDMPDNQVNADDIKIPKADEKKDAVIKPSSNFDVPDIDLDEIEVEGEEKKEEEPEDKKDDKKEDKKAEKKPDLPDDKKDDKKTGDDKPSEEEILARNEFLKNSVNYLVEKGYFKDFEGREELEVNEEVFAQLLEKQIEKQVEDRYDVKKKSAGEYGEAILEYLDNGGDADKIIDLFKEQKALDAFSIDDELSQTELITKWYKEVHGWKADKIKKFIDGLTAEEGALEAEADEVKSRYQEGYKKQLQELQEEQKEYNAQQLKKQKAFQTNINKVIDSNKDFDLKRKKFIKDSIFKLKTLEDGSQVNEFYLKFAEWQNDPERYIELAEFILDKEGYIKRKMVDVENKVTEKTFNFVKGNSALSKNKGSKHVEKDSASDSGTDFSVIFK